jgi:hypothetical protein
MSEVVLAASQCRTTLSEVFQTGASQPAINSWSCESSTATSKYVSSVGTDPNGVVSVKVSSEHLAAHGHPGRHPDAGADQLRRQRLQHRRHRRHGQHASVQVGLWRHRDAGRHLNGPGQVPAGFVPRLTSWRPRPSSEQRVLRHPFSWALPARGGAESSVTVLRGCDKNCQFRWSLEPVLSDSTDKVRHLTCISHAPACTKVGIQAGTAFAYRLSANLSRLPRRP